MKYGLTIERVQRVFIEIEAENNDAAIEKAETVFHSYCDNTKKFNDGCEGFDYALVDDRGVDLVPWSE